jgi:hypothetical protein
MYFGLSFAGWVMTYNTLPFGFKPACYIYQKSGMLVSSYLRQLGIPVIQYIDERLLVMANGQVKNSQLALDLMCSLGYTFSLQKCVLSPVTRLRFLGFFLDTEKRSFPLPEDNKKQDFKHLRESILYQKSVVPGALF